MLSNHLILCRPLLLLPSVFPRIKFFSNESCTLANATVSFFYVIICRHVDGPRDCHTEWSKPNREKQRFYNITYMWNLESPLDCKEIRPVHSEGHQPWDFFGGNDAKAETPVLWPPHAKSWLIGKDPDAGRDWGQEEKGTTEDEMAGWHHQLNGREFEWTPGVGDGQESLACCNSWGRKESDTTERMNWTELNWKPHQTGYFHDLDYSGRSQRGDRFA